MLSSHRRRNIYKADGQSSLKSTNQLVSKLNYPEGKLRKPVVQLQHH